MNDPLTRLNADDPLLRRAQQVIRGMRLYHRHRVVGVEHMPAKGRVLLTVNHSFATYDTAMICDAVFQATGRIPRGLGDRAMFNGPDKGRLARALGFVEARPENGVALLESDQIAVVAPGGMREALRPSHERYAVRWDRRKGFARLAMQTRTPIVLSACPDADRIYKVYENVLTKLIYQRARLPFPVLRGWGPSLLPRPVVLTHLLSEPLMPPDADSEDEAAVDAWHTIIVTRMNELMESARSLPAGGLRSGWRPAQVLGGEDPA